MRVCGKILLLCTVIGITSLSVGCGKTSINLNEYVSIEFSGYDGNGTATVEFDTDSFKAKYDDKLKYYGEDFSVEFFEDDPTWMFFEDCVDTKLSKDKELSNGDVVTLTWKCHDERALNNYKVKLEYSDLEYKVEGLDKVAEFDPFEGVEVKFSGISGKGTVNISSDNAEGITFRVDKNSGLSEGDTITVTADVGNPNKYAEKYGRLPSPTTKEYIAEGFDTYVLSNDVFTEDTEKMIYDKIDEVLKDYMKYGRMKCEKAGLSIEADLLWEVVGEITGDPKLVEVYIGNSKSGDPENCIFVTLQAPYKFTFTKSNWSGEVKNRVLGEGKAFWSVVIEDTLISGGDVILGDVEDDMVTLKYDELLLQLNGLKSEYNFEKTRCFKTDESLALEELKNEVESNDSEAEDDE